MFTMSISSGVTGGVAMSTSSFELRSLLVLVDFSLTTPVSGTLIFGLPCPPDRSPFPSHFLFLDLQDFTAKRTSNGVTCYVPIYRRASVDLIRFFISFTPWLSRKREVNLGLWSETLVMRVGTS